MWNSSFKRKKLSSSLFFKVLKYLKALKDKEDIIKD